MNDEESKRDVPLYLFRAASEQSAGFNIDTEVIPSVTRAGIGHNDICDIPLEQAKTMLEGHLLWNYRISSEFSSWSSSLLWVLQHAVRKHFHKGERHVTLFLLEPRKLLKPNIYPARTLLEVYNVKSEDKLMHEYYNAEYLAHGAIESGSEHPRSLRAVSLEVLLSCGLFTAFPELSDNLQWQYLARRVYQLRRTFFDFSGPTHPTDAQELANLRKLGECFGDEVALPMAIAFFTIRRRDITASGRTGTLDRVAEGLFEMKMRRGFESHARLLDERAPFTADLPEVAQFILLLPLIDKYILEFLREMTIYMPVLISALSSKSLGQFTIWKEPC
jgi:hypothetical protein